MASRISSWFDRRRFQVETQDVARLERDRILTPKGAGTVQVWVSLSSANVARIYFASISQVDGHAVLLVRDLPLANGLDEMGAERIGQVLHLSTVAIADGQAQSNRDEVEQKLREDAGSKSGTDSERQDAPHAAPSPPPRTLEVGAGYGVGFHGDEGIWHGPRVSAEYSWLRAFGVGGLLRTALPNEHTIDGVTQKVYAVSAGAFVSWHARITPNFDVYAYVGPGLETVRHRPTQANDPDVTLSSGQTEVRPNVVAGLGFALGKGAPRFALVFEGSALFSESRYQLLDRRRHDVSAKAAGFAPGVGLEVRF